MATTYAAPRFQVGQTVRIGHVRTAMADYTGRIAEVREVLPMLKARTERQGSYERRRNGPRMCLRDAVSVVLPSRWEGQAFVVDHGDYEVVYTADGFDYSLQVTGLSWGVGVRERDLQTL